ncbi:esterase/lipase family protein [Nocardia halotolerans]|uniref:Esterase/lipase family protein n=1 Tax=Nocardia halotolerans TaxID=1755878 RepID=A0ABV8VLF2_9NOCA
MSDDLVVIVPGITGSVLAPGGQPLWSLSAAALRNGVLRTSAVLDSLTLPSDLEELSDFEEVAFDTPEVIRGIHVWPGFWQGMGYGALIDRLESAVPGRVLCFPYDWRLPNAYTASKLRLFVEEALRRWPGRRVTFVCHSMGGLIARYYLEVLGGREHCARLITIGTPFSGAVKAVKALTGGLYPRIPNVGERVARVATTFPSVAELLPTYRCFDAGPGTEPLTLSEIDVPGLPNKLVLRGRRFHDELRQAVERNHAALRHGENSYPMHVFAGKLHVTDQSIAVDGSRLVYQQTQRGIDHAGDSTVPSFSAVPADWERDENALFRSAKHGPLVNHRDLLDDVIAKVTARELGAILAPLDELAVYLPEIASVAEPVDLTVISDSPNMRLHASIRDVDGHIHASHIPLIPDGSGRRYVASMGLPLGLWQVRIEEITKHPQAFVEDLITIV